MVLKTRRRRRNLVIEAGQDGKKTHVPCVRGRVEVLCVGGSVVGGRAVGLGAKVW